MTNGILSIKQDLTCGGAISYISKASVVRNIVNVADKGRYIQQSYYAGNSINRQAEGQSPSWSPWPWNPIQVGDYAGNRAQVLSSSSTSISTYVKCIPMLWDMNNMPAEAEMEQWTELLGNVLKVKNRITCHRTDSIYGEGVMDDQELPAVYPISALRYLYSYFGNAPFSNAPPTNTPVINLSSGFWGRYENNMVTENWMAFVDGTGWGMGVFNPSTRNFSAGVAGSFGGEASSGSTCYIAPVSPAAFYKNTIYEYTYYVIIGTVSDIRSAIYNLAGVGAGPAQSGTWTNANSGNWSDTNNWSGRVVANGSGNTANFSTMDITADVTVHLDSARTIGALVFGDTAPDSAANWIVDNNSNVVNTLTLDGQSTITVNGLGAGSSAAISARLAGTNGLVKLGAGTLTLSVANSYIGATTVNEGTLEIGGVGQLGGGSYTNAITNNATFSYNSTASQTLSGVISGTGAIVKANAGTLTISGQNNYTGATTVSTGALRLSNPTALPTNTTVYLVSGGTLDLAFTGTNRVTALFINGVNQGNGVFGTSNMRQITGGGCLQVGTGTTAPIASFTVAPTSGYEPLTVTFSDTSAGAITNRQWDFGDSYATNIAATSITHSYTAGTYTVQLIVSGDGGSDTNTQNNLINILTVPPPAFQADSQLSVDPVTGYLTFNIMSTSGLKYRISYNDDLLTNTWTAVTPPLPDGWTNGNDTPVTLQDMNTGGITQRFYRIESKSAAAP